MHHRLRRGLTLIEIIVVMAIIVAVTAIGAPTIAGVVGLREQRAATELAQTYIWLINEAQLRNVTFRMVFNLDRSTWKVEVGDPGTLVFATPEEREEYDQVLQEDMSRYTEREIEEGLVEEEEGLGRFDGLSDPIFNTEVELPSDMVFLFVYTPQYGEDGVIPSDDPPEDPEDDTIAYTYIFPDGSAEHTVIRMGDPEDFEDGYTIVVEPLSGQVQVKDDIIDPGESLEWIPEEGPTFQ